MTTIRAPYPSKMDGIHNQSVVSLDRPGAGDIANFSNRSTIVASLRIRNSASSMSKAVRRIGSQEYQPRDVIIRDWYKPFTSSIRLPDLPVLQSDISGTANSVTWSPDGNYLAVSHSTTPFITVYKRTGDTFTRVPDPTTLPSATTQGLSWLANASGLYIASADKTCKVYQKTNDTLTQIAAGVTVFSPLPDTAITKIRMTKDSVYAAIASPGSTIGSGPTNVYKRNGVNSKSYTMLAAGSNILPSKGVKPPPTDMSWTQDGVFLAVGTTDQYTPVLLYKRSGDVFTDVYGFQQIDQQPSTYTNALAFSLDDAYLAVASASSGGISIFSLNKNPSASYNLTFITKTTGANAPGADVKSMIWSPDGKYLMMTFLSSPYMLVYKFENNVLTKLSSFSSLAAQSYNDLDISPDGTYLASVGSSPPFVNVFKSAQIPFSGPFVRVDPSAPLINYAAALI